MQGVLFTEYHRNHRSPIIYDSVLACDKEKRYTNELPNAVTPILPDGF